MSGHDAELERIRGAYAERDAATPARSPWAEPGYRFYLQRLEWELLAALAAAGVDLPRARVLEVGCGSGYFAHRFAEYGAAHVAGVDLIDSRVRAALERYPELELVAGDAAELPWADGAFDVVAQLTCLSSILDAGVRAAVAREMWRVLRPGGVVLSFDMVRPHPLLRALRRARTRGAPAAGTRTATTPIEQAELRRLFPAAGPPVRAAGISVDAAGLARRGRAIAGLASSLPLLRTHLLVAMRKPG